MFWAGQTFRPLAVLHWPPGYSMIGTNTSQVKAAICPMRLYRYKVCFEIARRITDDRCSSGPAIDPGTKHSTTRQSQLFHNSARRILPSLTCDASLFHALQHKTLVCYHRSLYVVSTKQRKYNEPIIAWDVTTPYETPLHRILGINWS